MNGGLNITQNKRLTGILLTATVLLLMPLVVMQFTSEVKWSVFDFIVAGILLFGAGLSCELAMKKIRKIESRVIACAIILAAFFLIWAELAVGVFGTPFAGS